MPEAANEPTFAQEVNTLANKLTKDDKGIWQLPENCESSPEVQFAAALEKRRRDTESALGTSRHHLKTEQGIRQKLEQRVTDKVQINLSTDQAEILETLRTDDPEEWRKQMNELESEARTQLTSDLSADADSVSQTTEQDRRDAVLKAFNEEHPDAPLTDDMLEGDIPPRIVQKLAKGEITFEAFLQESHDFVTAGTVIGSETPAKNPGLGKAGGGSEPSEEAQEKKEVSDYSTTVF